MIGKLLRKTIRQLLLIFCILKKKKYVQLISQKLIRIVKKKKNKNKKNPLMIPNEEKKVWRDQAVKNYPHC